MENKKNVETEAEVIRRCDRESHIVAYKAMVEWGVLVPLKKEGE